MLLGFSWFAYYSRITLIRRDPGKKMTVVLYFRCALPRKRESMQRKAALSFVVAQLSVMLFSALALSGCGSSSDPQMTTPPPTNATVTVSIASSLQSLTAGQAAKLTATTNDPKGVTWTLSGQGSLSAAAPTSVTYNAPNSVSSAFMATVTATSVSDPKISKWVSISVVGSNVPGSRVAILNDTLPNGVVSVNYVEFAFVTGGVAPYTYSLSAGSLPPGLSILGDNNGTPYPSGTIYGTPTATGTSYFTFQVTDSANPPDVATQNFSLTVNPAGGLTISTPSLNNGEVGVYYQQLPMISGGTQPYAANITAGALPPGLQVSEGLLGSGEPSGLIYGAPSTAGTYNFTYQVLDSSHPPNVANANFSITIYPASTFAILTTSLPSGTVGAPYSQQPFTEGGIQPYTFSINAGALPPGVSLNSSTGAISGAPTTSGVYTFTYVVTDFAIPPQTVTANFSINIPAVPPPITITTTGSPNASVGTVYVATVQVTGGTPPYTFSPSSQWQNSNSGTISFVPASTGVQNFTVSVTDSLGQSGSVTLSVTVDPADCPNNANFQGNYAMLFNGPVVTVIDSVVEPTLFVGSFLADGAGNISQGYLDDGYTVTSTGLTGTYCIGPTNQGTLSYPAVYPSTSQNAVYLMNLDPSGNSDFMIYQNPNDPFFNVPAAFGFGTLVKQDTTAFSASKFVGQYSFGLSGGDGGVGEIQAGTFSSDGAGNLTNGELDQQGSGGDPYNVTFTANDFAVAPFGRGTVTLNESNGATVPAIFYVVNSSELFALAVPPSPTAYIVGPVIQSTGGPYTNSSLNGVSVFGLQGAASVPFMSQIGLITWDGAGNFTLTADQNQGGTLTTVSYSGTYNVESDGRVTLTSSGESSPPIFYLSGPNQGFIVGMGFDFTNGQFFRQSGGPFGSSSFSGSYLGRMLNTYTTGSSYCCLPAIETELDNFSADGVSSLTGISYLDDQWNGPSAVTVSSTYIVASSGRGVLSANGTQTDIFYIVSPTQVLMMPSSAQYSKVLSVTQD